MRRTFYCHVILFIIAVFSVNSISFSQNATIKGTIRHGSEILKAATITIGKETRISDDNGEFLFLVKPGTYNVAVTYAGYRNNQQLVSVNAGSVMEIHFEMVPNDQLPEFVLSSRSPIQRSNLNTPVPVDVFSFNQLVETGQVSIAQMLTFLAPSFNTSREVLNETATLRGLDPQHVLILVNGIRNHPMAWFFSGNLRGQLGRGSVGNDLNSIPFPAIEKIEILRDGATAQYGSDAIAGVINIKLKKATGTTLIQSHAGQYYKRDGDKFLFGINYGSSPGKKSFINLSGSYRRQDVTERGGTYEGPVYLNYSSNASLDDPKRKLDDLLVQTRGFNRKAAFDNAGNSQSVSKGFVINSACLINASTELLWTAILNSRKIDRGGAFSFPKDSAGVNYFLYPDGFQRRNKTHTMDASFNTILKGKTKSEWYWDAGSRFGINSLRSTSTNNNNASQTLILGANAPTSFYSGTDIFKQFTNDLNITKQFRELNIGWGAEWRWENYRSKPGEEASWKNYDPAHYSQGSGGGSGPENALNKHRNVFGAYVELEPEIKNNLLFNIAGRYEHYSDFGSNLAAKLAARYKLSQRFMIRGSVNNGFRAPSLQQGDLTSLNGVTVTRGGIRVETSGGIFPNTHEVVKVLGVARLTAEKTINVNGGFTSTLFKRIHITVDAYWIQIKDRIVLSGGFDRTENSRIDLILDRYPSLDYVGGIQFFTNSINTRTKGLDIVIDGNWSNKTESLGLNLSANFNSTRLYGPVKTSDTLATIPQSSNTIFNSDERTKIERGQPNSKIILSMTYKTRRIKLNIRNTRFGVTAIAPLLRRPETFSPKIITDVSLTYSSKSWATFTIGANNIANIYPDRLKYYENTSQGRWIYSPEASPFGFNGGYYYLNLGLNF